MTIQRSAGQPIAQGRLLIVDDDPFVRSVYASRLQHEGFTVELAENGEEALRMVRSSAPRLVLLDVNMPHMDGIQVLKSVRAHPSLKELPVIVYSNACTDAMVRQVWAEHPTRFLTKRQCTVNGVVEAIREAFREVGVPPPEPPAAAPNGGETAGDPSQELQKFLRARGDDAEREALLEFYQGIQPRLKTLRAAAPHTAQSVFGHAVEAFCEHLYTGPGTISVSTRRTLSQSLEVLLSLHSGDPVMLAVPPHTQPLAIILDRDAADRSATASALEKTGFRALRMESAEAAAPLLQENAADLIVLHPRSKRLQPEIAEAVAARINQRTPVLAMIPPEEFASVPPSVLSGGHDIIGCPCVPEELALKGLVSLLRSRVAPH